MKGFVSQNNVPVFWPERDIFVQRLFEVRHCLTQIAEVLRSMVVQSHPEYFLSSSTEFWVCLSDAPFLLPAHKHSVLRFPRVGFFS